MSACRLPCSFRSSASSSMMNLMMRLLIISESHGSRSSSGVECVRLSGRVLTFNEKVESSSLHAIDMTEDVLATEEATSSLY